MKLLKNPRFRIIDVAFELHFSSQEAFARAFKNYYQVTPKQYLQNNLGLIAKERPKITSQILEHLSEGINKVPRIETLPAQKYVGLEMKIPLFFGEHKDYNEMTLPLWKQLLKQKSQIKHISGNYAIGLGKGESIESIDEEMTYLVLYPVSEFENVLEGLITYKTREQKYAIFTNKGSGDKTSYSVSYIYKNKTEEIFFLRLIIFSL